MNRSNRDSSRASSSFGRRSLTRAVVEVIEARQLLTAVTGLVYDDANANGKHEYNEAGLSSEVVYADLNNNGIYDGKDFATRTNSAGYYTLDNLPIGPLTIRLRGDAATRVTSPAGNGYPIPNSGVGSDDFGVRPASTGPTTSVSGTVFDDANDNGKRDAGEAGLTGRYGTFSVFADLNRNGTFESNEPIGESADFASTYSITNVPVGATFDVRFLDSSPADDGRYQTLPAGFGTPRTVTTTAAPLTNVDFGFLYAGTLNGDAFRDANNNGTVDANETEPVGGAIWVDLDGDHVLDSNEPVVPPVPENIPNNVSARVLGLPFGTYLVAFAPSIAIGAKATLVQTIKLSPSQPNADLKIAVPTARPATATLAGRVTNDANANGLADAGEAGLASEVVYLDRNNNGTYDAGDVATRTDANGNYAFANVALDGSKVTVRIRAINAPRRVTAPANGVYVLTLAAGATTNGLNFSVTPGTPTTTTVRGKVYVDGNGNGKFDAGEPGLSGYFGDGVLYADLNRDGIEQSGEPTAHLDSLGNYTLTNVPTNATLDIRFADGSPALLGLYQDSPAGFYAPRTVTTGTAPIAGADFGFVDANKLDAIAFADVNGNEKLDGGESQVPGVIWIDLNNNHRRDANEPIVPGPDTFGDGPGNRYQPLGVPVDATYTIAFARSMALNALADVTTVINTGVTQSVQLAVRPAATSVAGRVTNDANGNGLADAGEAGLAGEVVFLDRNNNGTYDAGDVATRTNASGNYAFANVALDGSTVTVRLRGIAAPRTITAPSIGTYVLTLKAGATTTGLNFGVAPIAPMGTITGRVNYDFDFNGLDDVGEPGVAGLNVYADYNANGVRDAGEPLAVTGADGGYSLRANAGAFAVRLLTDGSIYSQTIVAGDPGQRVALAANATVADVDFEAQYAYSFTFNNPRTAANGSIGGVVFTDTNGNGMQDPGEPGRAGQVVYVILDDSDVPDASDLHAVTDAAGRYLIAGVPASGQRVEIRVGDIARSDVTGPAAGVYTGHLDSAYASLKNNFGIRPTVPLQQTIEGVVYVDANGDGKRGSAALEPLGNTATVAYADYNDNGVPDFGEPQARITQTGSYLLSVPATRATAFHVRVEYLASSSAVVAANPQGLADVDGSTVLRRDLGLAHNGTTAGSTATGLVFADANGNGRLDPGELPGDTTIYADYNNDGKLELATEPYDDLTYDGQFFLGGLPTDGRTVTLRSYSPTTSPAGGMLTVKFNGPSDVIRAGLNFGIVVPA